jgi:hypothetical protein
MIREMNVSESTLVKRVVDVIPAAQLSVSRQSLQHA